MKYKIGQRVYYKRDLETTIWNVGIIIDYIEDNKKYIIKDQTTDATYLLPEVNIQSLSNAAPVFDVVANDIPKKKRDKGSVGIRAEEDFMPERNSISFQLFFK
jgi:hypothetical protein